MFAGLCWEASEVDARRLIKRLRDLNVSGVALFESKVADNRQTPEVVADLLLEACAAITLRAAGCQVTMRERPDLVFEWNGEEVFAEVKHFRRKLQDAIDDRRLAEASEHGELVPYGNTVPTESVSAEQQVLDVLSRKSKILIPSKPNLVVIGSSSNHCVDDVAVQIAVTRLESRQHSGLPLELRRISGVLYMSPDFSLKHHRSAYSFPSAAAEVPLSSSLRDHLEDIRQWHTG